MGTKIRRIGDALVVAVSEEMLAGLGLREGDEGVARAGDRVIELSAVAPGHERLMRLAEKIMDQYDEALAELA